MTVQPRSSDIRYLHGAFGRLAICELRRSTVTHAHEDIQLVFALNGSATGFTIDEIDYAIDDDQGVFVDCFQPHHYSHRGHGAARVLMLHLNMHWAEGNPLIRGLGGRLAENALSVDHHTRQCLEDLTTIIMRDEAEYAANRAVPALLKALMGAGIHDAIDNETAAHIPTVTDFRIRKALRMIARNASNHLDFSALSRECGISRPHFFDQFRRHLGIPPRIYLNAVLMRRIVEMLADTDRPLCHIADDLGFSAPGNFTRFFRRHMGVSPEAYRRAMGQGRPPDPSTRVRQETKTQTGRIPPAASNHPN